ncbi:STAS domain-containing protein [Pseudohongiella sp.]
MHITNDCLVVTLPTDLDSEVTRELSALLNLVDRHRHRGLVIDLSLMDILPSKLASLLEQLSRASSLLNAPTVICGIKPGLASALALLGIRFDGVRKARNMDHALAELTQLRSANVAVRSGY